MLGKTAYVLLTATMVWGCGPGSDSQLSRLPMDPALIAGTGVPNLGLLGSSGTTSTLPNAQAGVPSAGGGAGQSSVQMASAGRPAAVGGAAGAAGSSTAKPAGCKSTGPCSHGTDPVIPEPIGECPPIVSGGFTFMGVTSQLWVGTKSATAKGPIMLYWHGTGGNALTAVGELDPTLVSEIMAQGGVIGSITEGLKGDTLDWGVFTTGDYQTADQIVACAVKQMNIDTKRIYASGASAGGLASGELVYGRSSYMAGALPNSGGQGGYPMNMILQDPTHVPAVMTMHGARGVDVVVIDFGDSSLREDIDIAKKGGFAVDCDHGGPHVGAPGDLKAAGWDFLKKHPFGFGTSPYAAGLPSSYPSYCKIVTKDTPMPAPMM